MTSKSSKPMVCRVDLDWATYVCPCGDDFCTRYASPEECQGWTAEHRPHTNGNILDIVTDDGARCLASKPEPTERPWT